MIYVVCGLSCLVAVLSAAVWWNVRVTNDKKIIMEQLLDVNECIRELLIINENDKTIKEYFDNRRCSKIAIWGINRFSKVIVKELYKKELNIVYCIDDTINAHYDIDVDVYYPLDNLPQVDVILCVLPIPPKWQDVFRTWDTPVVKLSDVLRDIRG